VQGNQATGEVSWILKFFTERTAASTLCVTLLDLCNMSRNVFGGACIFHVQPVALAFNPCSVDEDPRISRETSKCQAYVRVEFAYFSNSSGLLEFGSRLFFNAQNNNISASNSNLRQNIEIQRVGKLNGIK